MVITKTPFRMSFFGGGTDLKDYFSENGGAVLSTTIDKYCYVTVRHLPPFFDYRTEIAYSQLERVGDVSDIRHPMVRNAMKMLKMKDLRITYEGDLPARSGLGTSSSFAVGLLNAFYCLNGEYVDKRRLAQEAIHLERDICNESGGWQDQIAASYGGLNRINFHDDEFEVKPVIISSQKKEQLDKSLVMFFTGFTRMSSDIQKNNKLTDNKGRLDELKDLVDEAERVLTNPSKDITEFGKLLDYTWRIKRQSGKSVTTEKIDDLYERGIKAGALGGKLLGAGGGGFMVFFIDPEAREQFISQMDDLLHIPFSFENAGTTVAYYVSEENTKDN